MSRLFIFAIGGTGSRVLKSLSMLLASGVQTDVEAIVPIIIDPHVSNDDVKRTIDYLKYYRKIHQSLTNGTDKPTEGFFKVPIKTLQELSGAKDIKDSFAFDIQNVQSEKFRQYIDLSSLDIENRALAELLFSEKSLEIEMNIGFIGHPNIGSIVLNQFKDSEEFRTFAQCFQPNDRIFIISSIFGGTGAAGFPVVLKNIREAHDVKSNGIPLPNPQYLKQAVIGAATVQPYFSLDVDTVSGTLTAGINSEDFISKTTAALHYYQNNISGNSSINAMYYVGDSLTKSYKNDPGNGGQQNDAHFIEMITALGIIDFMGQTELTTDVNGRAEEPIYREFGVRNDKPQLNFLDLAEDTLRMIKKPLTQYFLMVKYLEKELMTHLKEDYPFFNYLDPKIDGSFLTKPFYTNNLQPFNQGYKDWLSEMARNERGFVPFNLDTPQWEKMVNGIDIKKGSFFNKTKLNSGELKTKLNIFRKEIFGNPEEKFLKGLYLATNSLLESTYNDF